MKVKNIFLLTGFLSILLFNLNCAQDEPDGPTVFNNVIQMDAERTPGGTINFSDVPDEVTILVVGIFDGNAITVDENNSITNTDWIGGNRTGLTGIDRDSAYSFWQYNSVTKDFNNGTPLVHTAPDSWAVWGYNADGIVICSTDKRTWN